MSIRIILTSCTWINKGEILKTEAMIPGVIPQAMPEVHSTEATALILAARVSKYADELIEELVGTIEGKINCKRWNSKC